MSIMPPVDALGDFTQVHHRASGIVRRIRATEWNAHEIAPAVLATPRGILARGLTIEAWAGGVRATKIETPDEPHPLPPLDSLDCARLELAQAELGNPVVCSGLVAHVAGRLGFRVHAYTGSIEFSTKYAISTHDRGFLEFNVQGD